MRHRGSRKRRRDLTGDHEEPRVKQFDPVCIPVIGAFSEADQAGEQKKEPDDQGIRRMEEEQHEKKEEEMLLMLSRDTYFDLFRNRNVMIACTLYALVGMVQSAQDSLLPLYLINSVDKGGFNFDQTDIGWLYTGIGPIQIVFNHILIVVELNWLEFLHFTSSLSTDRTIDDLL